MPKYGHTFQAVFEEDPNPLVRRDDVFKAFSRSDRIGCLTALAWGFPRGNRPGGRTLRPDIDATDYFVERLRELRHGHLTADAYDALNCVPGVKNGVTTKLLYFAQIKAADGVPALIYDSRVRDHLLFHNWDEYQGLTDSLRRHQPVPTAQQYLRYLTITSQVAEAAGWRDPAAVEMFMFSNVPTRRAPRHT